MALKLNHALCLVITASLLTTAAWADGWSDLQSALERLQGTAPISAQLETEVWSTTGDDEDKTETHALASVLLKDDENGFQMLYKAPLLSVMEQEQEAAVTDPGAKTPTLEAVAALTPNDLRSMLSAANMLKRQLEDSEFTQEESSTYEGSAARLLTFEKGLEALPENEREHVKEFESTIKVWIADNGTPLASESNMRVKGRFMVVIKFEFTEAATNRYVTEGQRLVVVERESHNHSSGAGEKEDSREVRRLMVTEF